MNAQLKLGSLYKFSSDNNLVYGMAKNVTAEQITYIIKNGWIPNEVSFFEFKEKNVIVLLVNFFKTKRYGSVFLLKLLIGNQICFDILPEVNFCRHYKEIGA